jgi:hypothetical protein
MPWDNRAMTSLNLASNSLGSEGAKHVAEAIKVSVLLRLFWYQFYAEAIKVSVLLRLFWYQFYAYPTNGCVCFAIIHRIWGR